MIFPRISCEWVGSYHICGDVAMQKKSIQSTIPYLFITVYLEYAASLDGHRGASSLSSTIPTYRYTTPRYREVNNFVDIITVVSYEHHGI